MTTLEIPSGIITAMDNAEFYATGALKSCVAVDESPLATRYGTLMPQFSSNTVRKRQLPCISFHENGMPNVLPLEEQISIQTPLGKIPAEKVTFYPDGAVKRVFPLNGCLSGYWEMEDEIQLARPVRIETPCGPVEKRLISLYFGPKGNLRSLTFWPGEKIRIESPVGPLPVRIGLSFHDSGKIKSLEPAIPVGVKTPMGGINAFNPDAHGITGDRNSLCFDESGRITSLVTTASSFIISEPNGNTLTLEAPMRTNPVDGETREPTPVTVRFEEDTAIFTADGMAKVCAPVDSVRAKGLLPLFTARQGQPVLPLASRE